MRRRPLRLRIASSRLAALVALALSAPGCPGDGAGAPPGTASDPGRTAAAERRQIAGKLAALAAAPDAAAEERALRGIVLWLQNPRPWRTEGYTLQLRAAPSGPPLTVEAARAHAQQRPAKALGVACPHFAPNPPATTWTPHDPAHVELLRPVVRSDPAE